MNQIQKELVKMIKDLASRSDEEILGMLSDAGGPSGTHQILLEFLKCENHINPKRLKAVFFDNNGKEESWDEYEVIMGNNVVSLLNKINITIKKGNTYLIEEENDAELIHIRDRQK